MRTGDSFTSGHGKTNIRLGITELLVIVKEIVKEIVGIVRNCRRENYECC